MKKLAPNRMISTPGVASGCARARTYRIARRRRGGRDPRVASAGVIDAVCRLAEEHAAVGAAAGRLDDAVVAALRDARLFKLYLPGALGGLGLDLVEATDTIARLAEADPAAGWAVMIGAGPNWFADHMAAPLLEEVFGPRDSCVAGSGKVGAAVPDGDEWRVTGRGRWCSGAPWATWFTFNAAVPGGDPVRPFTFAVPATAVTRHADTW